LTPSEPNSQSIYGWFTEGFGAPDVTEANALFEALDATPTASAIRSGCGTKPKG